MRTNLAATLLLVAAPWLIAQEAAKERLTFEDTFKQVSWTGNPPSASIAWDGKHVVVRDGDVEQWLDPKTGQTNAPQSRPAPDAAEPPPKGRTSWRATI